MDRSDSICELAEALVGELADAGCTVATAESCTGGWIAKSLTDVAGSSACFGFGIVSYSNGAKEALVSVSALTLAKHGAVSAPVVREMAEGVLKLSGADLSVAVSGVAGPDGGTAEKPVGTVWLAWAEQQKEEVRVDTDKHQFAGDRDAVRAQTVVCALQGVRDRLRSRG